MPPPEPPSSAGGTASLSVADQYLYAHLEAELQAHAITLPLPQEVKIALVRYLRLLERWNRVFNLTAVRLPKEMIVRHLLDALLVIPYLRGHQMLDVGTGAGLPGLVLAIACPWSQWLLLDATRKKIRFCHHVVAQLKVFNALPLQGNIENFNAPPRLNTTTGLDVIISRATFSIPQLIAKTRHLWQPQTRIIAMKTKATVAAELEGLELSARIQVQPLKCRLPHTDRQLVLIDDLTPVHNKY